MGGAPTTAPCRLGWVITRRLEGLLQRLGPAWAELRSILNELDGGAGGRCRRAPRQNGAVPRLASFSRRTAGPWRSPTVA
jgi:hypothetical protein